MKAPEAELDIAVCAKISINTIYMFFLLIKVHQLSAFVIHTKKQDMQNEQDKQIENTCYVVIAAQSCFAGDAIRVQ